MYIHLNGEIGVDYFDEFVYNLTNVSKDGRQTAAQCWYDCLEKLSLDAETRNRCLRRYLFGSQYQQGNGKTGGKA
jgi:hypothetical protein